MRSDHLYALSVKLESERLTGSGGEDLLAEDLFPVLEKLQDLGVDLSPLENTSWPKRVQVAYE